jgi:murein L,D-transpeptidase YafK
VPRRRLLAVAPVALALAALAPAARAGPVWIVPERQVFPGGDGASADTLDRPLAGLIQAFRQRTGKRTFRKRIVVHKARRRMDVYADGEVLKSYLVELGASPVGDKRRQGDMRTPEGDLFLCTVNRASQFTRFLGLAYPTPAGAAAGVAERRVGAAVERDVRAAYRTRDRCPPQLTPLGGAVGIHGSGQWERRPDGFALSDWTWGCVAVRDQDILELFEHYAEVGIAVEILKD